MRIHRSDSPLTPEEEAEFQFFMDLAARIEHQLEKNVSVEDMLKPSRMIMVANGFHSLFLEYKDHSIPLVRYFCNDLFKSVKEFFKDIFNQADNDIEALDELHFGFFLIIVQKMSACGMEFTLPKRIAEALIILRLEQ